MRYGARPGEGPALGRVSASDRADIAAQVARIFEAVPGLIAGLAPGGDGRDVLTHVRLIFSASELALVPFEMALSPPGFPSEGDPLSTQSVAPLLMTREIRGAAGHERPWPAVPRVLFAWAQPPDQSPVPWRAHLQALVGALRPWTGRAIEGLSDEASARRLKRHLTVLADATLHDVASACAEGAYTHVHLLAHGGRQESTEHPRFALLLRGAGAEPDRVGAERLAAALAGQLAVRGHEGAGFACPAVVTLATCDSGNQGDVLLPGSSLAHALHAAGVPLVVGSLFPLSKAGSVTLTEALYRGLFAGDDPRVALLQARLALRTADVDTHDWASAIAYASFPATLDEQALSARYEAARQGVSTVNDQIETLVRAHEEGRLADAAACERDLERLADDLEFSAWRLPTRDGYEIEGHGLLGSQSKRKAQALFAMAKAAKAADAPERHERFLRDSFKALTLARASYGRAVDSLADPHARRKKGAPAWVLTQALSLDVALGLPLDAPRWRRARAAAEVELVGQPADVAWAHGSLLELYLLRAFVPDAGAGELLAWTDAAELAERSAAEVAAAVRLDPFIVESTLRQLARYLAWWGEPLWTRQLERIGRPPAQPAWARFDPVARTIVDGLKKTTG